MLGVGIVFVLAAALFAIIIGIDVVAAVAVLVGSVRALTVGPVGVSVILVGITVTIAVA